MDDEGGPGAEDVPLTPAAIPIGCGHNDIPAVAVQPDKPRDNLALEDPERKAAEQCKLSDPRFEYIFQAVDRGDIALLRGDAIVQLDDEGRRLERRQDMALEAYWTVGELRRRAPWANCYCSRSRWIHPGMFFISSLLPGVLIAVLSYQWQTDAHPDPEQRTLGLLAKRLRKGIRVWLSTVSNFVGGPCGCVRYAAEDIAVFWDFASLHQKDKERGIDDRTEAQLANFVQGLGTSNVLYGHALTVMLRSTEIPGVPEKVYSNSGWCTFESTVAAAGKYEPYQFFIDLCKGHSSGSRRFKELDLVSPQDFAKIIETKRFYSSLDRSKLVKMYTEVYNVHKSTSKLRACEKACFEHCMGFILDKLGKRNEHSR